LIQAKAWCNVRAMFKTVVILISIVWASLLLISWGGAGTPSPSQNPVAFQDSVKP
jgi:hypothetical protein